MNKIILLLTAFLVGCGTTSIPTSIEDYDEERVAREAKKLGMRPVDYLHYVNNQKSTQLFLWQAHDPTWDDPSINPVFDTKAEAEKYAKENNMGNHHSYQVREVNFRYEVRQVNDLINDLLHTSLTFNNAYDYVVEYSSSHSDLIIYDLKTGKIFKETP
jgi:hypothetical protein